MPTQDPGCVCAKANAAGYQFAFKRVALGPAGISCTRYCQTNACTARPSCAAAVDDVCAALPAAPAL